MITKTNARSVTIALFQVGHELTKDLPGLVKACQAALAAQR